MQFPYLNLPLFGNARPVLGGKASPPLEIHRHPDGGLLVMGREAREVVASLVRGEGEVARVHLIRVMDAVPVR